MPCKHNSSSPSLNPIQPLSQDNTARPYQEPLDEKTLKSLTGMTLKDSGNRQQWETGAQRDVGVGKGRFDLLPPYAIERLAKLYEAGCLKYGDRNWEKGIPQSRYLDSALRHLFKFLRGETDEDHLVAAAWNITCAMDNEARCQRGILPKELLDLPIYEQVKETT